MHRFILSCMKNKTTSTSKPEKLLCISSFNSQSYYCLLRTYFLPDLFLVWIQQKRQTSNGKVSCCVLNSSYCKTEISERSKREELNQFVSLLRPRCSNLASILSAASSGHQAAPFFGGVNWAPRRRRSTCHINGGERSHNPWPQQNQFPLAAPARQNSGAKRRPAGWPAAPPGSSANKSSSFKRNQQRRKQHKSWNNPTHPSVI